jgi:hypothetical protein
MHTPIDGILSQNLNVLWVGVGGGFDIYGSIPLLQEGSPLVLANFNGSRREMVCHSSTDQGDTPEARLASFLAAENRPATVYALPRCGVKLMRAFLQDITSKHNIDCVICVDGGVDSIMMGTEEGAGTLLEDTVTMTAVDLLDVEHKKLVCLGFGTEMEEALCHHSALENMAVLTRDGAFLGSCSLVKGDEYDLYKRGCEHGWSDGRKSHIHSKVISAVEGLFGNTNLYCDVDARVGALQVINYITPLMPIYWFFHLEPVIQRNALAKPLSITNTWTDVMMVYRQLIDVLKPQRPRQALPL